MCDAQNHAWLLEIPLRQPTGTTLRYLLLEDVATPSAASCQRRNPPEIQLSDLNLAADIQPDISDRVDAESEQYPSAFHFVRFKISIRPMLNWAAIGGVFSPQLG